MKQPLNFLLYTASLGLLGVAGHQFYYAFPRLGGPNLDAAQKKGSSSGDKRLAAGAKSITRDSQWDYTRKPFWDQFKTANFTGKLPPKPVDPTKGPGGKKPEPPKPAERPLNDLVSLVSVFHVTTDDAPKKAEGEEPKKPTKNGSRVTIRYTDSSGVQIPEDVQARLAASSSIVGDFVGSGAAARTSGPRTRRNPRSTNGPRTRRNNGADQGARTPAPTTAMPSAGQVSQVTHTLEIGDTLWKPFDHIKLVRAHEDARSAYFVRVKEGADGDEEEVFSNEFSLDSEDLKKIVDEVRKAEGKETRDKPNTPKAAAGDNFWVADGDTQRIPGKRNSYSIGTNDQATFQNSPEEIFDKVTLRPYRGKNGRSGLEIGAVDPALAARYGVDQGDVILSVNGQSVTSKAQAINHGKKLYNRGVRTFRVEVLSFGRVETRTYYSNPDS